MPGTGLRRAFDPPIEFAVDGDISLYPVGGQHAIVLNHTASDIWRLLEGPIALDDLIATLASRYGCRPAEIGPEVNALIDTLVAHGVVVSEDLSPQTSD